MRETNSRQLRAAPALIILLLTLGLLGCADTGQKPEEVTTTVPAEEKPPESNKINSLNLPPSQFSEQFSNAEQSLARFDWMQASVDLQGIPTSGLTPDDATYQQYLEARIEFIRGNQQQALELLDSIDGPQIHPALRYRILSFKHHMLALEGDHIQSANVADQALRLTPPDTEAGWQRKIWRNLQRANLEQLQTAQPGASDRQWQGWLELAVISHGDKPTMADQLTLWRQANPGHPAADPLPGGLGYALEPTPDFGPIALILPLSGRLAPAGKAVLDGYMAAYYQSRASGRAAEELLVFDITNYPSANAVYDEALNQGARIVVGPLDKADVTELALRLERPIPILALNRIDQAAPPTVGSAIVQLTLTHEDEAARLAEIAFGQGARSALIISPDDNWGSKVKSSLTERWTALGGTVASSVDLMSQEDYSGSLKSTLGLFASEQRSLDVRNMLATNIEFTPRRRQDLDVIFLLTRDSSQARAIKPLLGFHYAGALPVYAISTVYSGVQDDRNNDLNGIHLIETPWLLGANPSLQLAIAAGDANQGNYTRLNALGADAFLLQSSFNRLNSGADVLVKGNTGLLSMDPNLRIHRELSPATFDGGEIQAQ